MTDDDIRFLAKVMGKIRLHTRHFDPFSDANDDYAVLEWMRKAWDPNEPNADRWIEALHIQINGSLSNYQIGCYARAAVTVLRADIEEPDDD